MSITARPLDTAAPRTVGVRLRVALAGAIGTASGIAPHVLHHVGPIAGAAVVSGLTGTLVFGVVGLLLMVPSLLRLRRRFGTWVAPGIALFVFATLFTISTVWVGPAIRERLAEPEAHSTDHPGHEGPGTSGTVRP